MFTHTRDVYTINRNTYRNVLFLPKLFFPGQVQRRKWTEDLLTVDLPTEIWIYEHEQLIDISSDSVTKWKFASSSEIEHWKTTKNQYVIGVDKTDKTLIPFAFSWSRETGVSALEIIETIFRSRLKAEKEIRIAFSKFIQIMVILCAKPKPQIILKCI